MWIREALSPLVKVTSSKRVKIFMLLILIQMENCQFLSCLQGTFPMFLWKVLGFFFSPILVSCLHELPYGVNSKFFKHFCYAVCSHFSLWTWPKATRNNHITDWSLVFLENFPTRFITKFCLNSASPKVLGHEQNETNSLPEENMHGL